MLPEGTHEMLHSQNMDSANVSITNKPTSSIATYSIAT